jgi:DNA-binding response OmpR family regulator
VLTLGPLTIDIRAPSVRRADEEVTLTHTEFLLLVELA